MNDISVFALDYNDTSIFAFVTKLSSTETISHSFGLTYNGYLWYVSQGDGHFAKQATVARLPRDLRESLRYYQITDLLNQCVDYDYYNATVMQDTMLYYSVVTRALNLSGLQYFYPNRTGFVDWTLFNRIKLL